MSAALDAVVTRLEGVAARLEASEVVAEAELQHCMCVLILESGIWDLNGSHLVMCRPSSRPRAPLTPPL